jgi:hypothetical protein
MGYMHIDNLYKAQDIMMFRECYALEKIHGTSAHIGWKCVEKKVYFFSGGESHEKFSALFDVEKLEEQFKGMPDTVVYGEAYGGKCQGMSGTYGKELKFVVFDVKINEMWLAVPNAEDFAVNTLGLEFVDYVKIPTELAAMDGERDKPSVQAVRNGIEEPRKREGVVLRPLVELTKNNGDRIIVKHKGDDFKETKTKREMDPEKLKVLEDAKEVADEWVTPMRINHVLDKIENPAMEKMREIIAAMTEDVKREGEGEIVWSPAVEKAIGKATALGVKEYFKNKLVDSHA